MGFGETDTAVAMRFATYVEGLAGVIGHKDRVRPLRDYCMGLMMPCERKSVEPMAAVTAPSRTAAQHQSLLHFVGEGNWSDERVLAKVRAMVLPAIERQGPIEAWIIERTIAWLNRCRRLAKDWENLNRSALAFLKLASIRLMLRKLCNP